MPRVAFLGAGPWQVRACTAMCRLQVSDKRHVQQLESALLWAHTVCMQLTTLSCCCVILPAGMEHQRRGTGGLPGRQALRRQCTGCTAGCAVWAVLLHLLHSSCLAAVLAAACIHSAMTAPICFTAQF